MLLFRRQFCFQVNQETHQRSHIVRRNVAVSVAVHGLSLRIGYSDTAVNCLAEQYRIGHIHSAVLVDIAHCNAVQCRNTLCLRTNGFRQLCKFLLEIAVLVIEYRTTSAVPC